MLARSFFRIFLVSTLGNLVTLFFGYFLVHNHFEPAKVNIVKSHSLVGTFSADSSTINKDSFTGLLTSQSHFKVKLLNKNFCKKISLKRFNSKILFKSQSFKKSLLIGENRSRAPPKYLSLYI